MDEDLRAAAEEEEHINANGVHNCAGHLLGVLGIVYAAHELFVVIMKHEGNE